MSSPNLKGACSQSRSATCEHHPILLDGRCLECGEVAEHPRVLPSAAVVTPSIAVATPCSFDDMSTEETPASPNVAGPATDPPIAETRYPDAAAAGVVLWAAGQTSLVGWDPIKQKWSLPGGKRELGESIRACAAREVYEETLLRDHDLQIDWSNFDYIRQGKYVYYQGHLGSNQPSVTATFTEYRHVHLQEPPSKYEFCLERVISNLRARSRRSPLNLLENFGPAIEQGGAEQPPAKRRRADASLRTNAGAEPARRKPFEGTNQTAVSTAASEMRAAPNQKASSDKYIAAK